MSALPEGTRRARTGPLVLCLAAALVAAGCGAAAAPRKAPAAAARGGTVAVLYAGALVSLMEHGIAPAFDRATGYRFQGFAGGSVALANQIKGKLRRADVFISALPQVDGRLMGKANGGWVSWYAPFAEAPLVIGYNPKSRFAARFKTEPWYQVMAEPGFRLGRTDPKLDPKGTLTVRFMHAAARYYHRPGLTRRLLGAVENPAQVFPEETLVGRLQTGQLDAGFFYSNEAVQAHIPYVRPPAAIDPRAGFTVTVVHGAADEPGAVAFVKFLLGPRGRAIMRHDGLTPVAPRPAGDAAAVPAALRSAVR